MSSCVCNCLESSDSSVDNKTVSDPNAEQVFYLKQATFSHCLCDESLVNFDLYQALYGLDDHAMSSCLVRALNIDFIELRVGLVNAVIKIDDIHCRPTPIGSILHGGTSLAFAETIAGVASTAICKDKEHPVGVSVNANHIAMAFKGQSLFAQCSLIHKGASSHLWNVDISDDKGRLISTARVTNAIIKG